MLPRIHLPGALRRVRLSVLVAVWLGVAPLAYAATAAPPDTPAAPKREGRAPVQQQRFDSAQAASDALIAAARSNDAAGLRGVLGRGAGRVLSSGDSAQDEGNRIAFVAAADEGTRIDAVQDGRAVLLLGAKEWPLPFPLVRDRDQRWRFDTRAGLQEFLDRQIGANELSAVQVALAYVDAQREYVLRDHTRDGLLEYAQHLVSSTDRHDGLYWPTTAGEPASPMGAAIGAADARTFGGAAQSPLPYHGYQFRVLKAQGPAAPGGALRYMVGDRLIGGFALVAYPARWRVSGVMTFIVNHDGVVYSRDLGPSTLAIASAMERYDPAAGWTAEPLPTSAGAPNELPLLGTTWRLMSPAPVGRSPELQLLEGARLAGSDGCNRLIGSYTLAADALNIGALAASRMACPHLQGSDAVYTATLGEATHWRISGRRLDMLHDDKVVLTFEAAAH